ncbi:hypothetical protein SeLEV6574_g04980 [Synchytrium endobioticum]|uniref:Secreted protein n=1 Tax=Synchytrium endobioticum TaxID=286115 RepID=A0A507CWP6_9FUNG|nr:hypothetical protein SeLEV6574_g04980 [Synchytrium endobioticum]
MMKKVITIVVLQATMLYYLVSAGGCLSGGHGQDTADFATRVTTPAQGVADKARRLKEAQGLAELPARTATLRKVPTKLAALVNTQVQELAKKADQVVTQDQDIFNLIRNNRAPAHAYYWQRFNLLERAKKVLDGLALEQDRPFPDLIRAKNDLDGLALEQGELVTALTAAAVNLADVPARENTQEAALADFQAFRQEKRISQLHHDVANEACASVRANLQGSGSSFFAS